MQMDIVAALTILIKMIKKMEVMFIFVYLNEMSIHGSDGQPGANVS